VLLSFHFISFHFISFHFISFHFISFHFFFSSQQGFSNVIFPARFGLPV